MSKISKIVSYVLAMILAFGMVTPVMAYDVAEDVKGTAFEEAAQTLGALNIMIGDDKGNFRPDDTVTRAEFSKIAVHLLGLSDVAESSKEVSKYPDVSVDHWANGYINVATAQGLIIGDDTGTFRPEDGISYQEANTILIRLLGYEKLALNKGGYPTGYLVQANDIGLTKKASASGVKGCLRGITAQLAFNALTINLMEATGYTDGNLSYEVTDKTVLENKLNVEKKTGIVTANDVTSLSASSALDEGRVEFDGKEIFFNGPSKANRLLGRNVTYYVKTEENGDKTVILAREEENKNTIITIDAKDLTKEITKDSTSIFYKENEDANEEEVLLANDFKVVYNDKFAKELSNPKTGSITLIDSTRDNKFDTVFINEYVTYVIDDVSTAGKKVYDKYEKPALDFNTDKNKNLIVILEDANGNAVKFEDLKEWNVLSVYKNTDYIRAIVSSEYVTGELNERDEADQTIGINDKHYEIADNREFKDYTLGLEGTFYIDAQGKIAAYDAEVKKGNQYAYLVAAGTSGSISSYLDIKYFAEDGSVVTAEAANKIKINGKSYSDAEEAYKALLTNGKIVPQIITLDVNAEGKISAINTAEDKTASFPSSFEKDMFALNFKGEGLIFKASVNKLTIMKDGKATGSIGIDENTKVLIVPENSTDTDEMEIGSLKTFTDESSYNVEVFDIKENMTAGLIRVTNIVNVGKLESAIAVIEKISLTNNEDGDRIHKLTVKTEGETKVISTEDDTIITADGRTLKSGDIIQIKTNAKGEMDGFTLLLNSDDVKTEFSKTYGNDNEMVIVYGKVTKKFSDSINVTVNDQTAQNYSTTNATVLKLDTNKTTNKVTVTDAGEISKWEDEANEERVFIRIYKDEVKEIVIVK